ncbi:MAG: hypothetical protein JRJ77_17340 [Deltaproteobacteria bacterium]|nr:hypothetical protein [Deltaproteobacteria bacterium]
MRSKINFRFPVVLSLLWLAGLITISFDAIPCWASGKGSEPPVFSLDVKNMPLKEIFKDILNTTGYQILFDKKWENERITVKLDNVPLIPGLKQILRNAGIENYSLVERNRTLEIYTLGHKHLGQIASIIMNSDGTGLTREELKALHERQKREIEKMANDPDVIVIPPEGDRPGVTRRELQALHERQMREIEMRANDPDEIVIPPEGGHAGVTRRQLEALHERQKREIEMMANDPDEIVIPPEGGHAGITRRELKALHERQKREIEMRANDPDEIVIPPEGGHAGVTRPDGQPGLTRRELKALHERQKKQFK